jgi:hypothetical protein
LCVVKRCWGLGSPCPKMAMRRSLVGRVLKHLLFQKRGPCFFKNTYPIFSKTWILFFQKHGPCFFKNTDPKIGEKRCCNVGGFGEFSWGDFGGLYFTIFGCKSFAGRGLFRAISLVFLHNFGPRCWGRRRLHFGTNSFYISAKNHFIFPQKAVSYFLKKAFHIPPKKHYIFPTKYTLYF